LIDKGSTINIISTIAFQNLNILFSHIKAPNLQLKSFNDALCPTVGSIFVPITVGSKIVETVLQVIEGDITQYNVFLGRPWIKDMQYIPSTYHNYLKYIHDGIVHYVHGDDNPYSHCNIARILDEITLPSTHFFMMSLSKYSKDNDKQIMIKYKK